MMLFCFDVQYFDVLLFIYVMSCDYMSLCYHNWQFTRLRKREDIVLHMSLHHVEFMVWSTWVCWTMIKYGLEWLKVERDVFRSDILGKWHSIINWSDEPINCLHECLKIFEVFEMTIDCTLVIVNFHAHIFTLGRELRKFWTIYCTYMEIDCFPYFHYKMCFVTPFGRGWMCWKASPILYHLVKKKPCLCSNY